MVDDHPGMVSDHLWEGDLLTAILPESLLSAWCTGYMGTVAHAMWSKN